MSLQSRPRPTGGFELAAWIFMRGSGVVLVFLALGHLAIMHIINTVDTIDYDFVAKRFATPLWRSYDCLLLILAMLHGVNGARVVIDDYFRGGWRILMLALLYIVALVTLVVGAVLLFTFQPVGTGTM
jgi:succinate dehydrogenase / fumarate reductase membrane anchor subunit